MDARQAGVVELDQMEPQQRELFEALRLATLGEYDIYSELGRGGMATVYLALELSLNRSVAIKVISPSALTSGTLVERFWLEARTAASLSHPHVIPIYAVRSVSNLHFFVMKYVEGGSLDAVLKTEGRLSISLVTTILAQVASALAYAHRRGVIHRDVKPANIMLDDEGFAIVMDFGIAKVRDVTALTTSGTMVGTPYYMSPEQFSDKELDGRSDQYSLGVVAFELLTGRRPFTGESIGQILRGHLLDNPPNVRDLRPDCPESLAMAVNRMLCKSPEDRFLTLEALPTLLGSLPSLEVDRVREQMMSLARTASLSRPRISQPTSPTPVSRPSTQPTRQQARVPQRSLAPFGRGAAWVQRRPLLSGTVGLVVLVASASLLLDGRNLRPVDSSLALGGTASPLDSQRVASPATSRTAAAADSGSPPAIDGAKQLDAPPVPPAPSLAKPQQDRGRPSATDAVTARAKPKKEPVSSTRPEVQPVPQSSAVNNLILSPVALQTVTTSDSAETIPVLPSLAAVRIGTRIPRAGLYVDGVFAGLISGLRTFTHKPGQIHLEIRAEDCISYDTTVVVMSADTARINYRSPTCIR
jgi:serine/threonine protein kinase